MQNGHNIVEYHSSELFPERWFDVVYVTAADNEVLFDRLKARGYNEKKSNSNMLCEIFKTALEEANESYNSDIVHELASNTEEDLKANVMTIENWYTAWLNQASVS